VKHIIHRKFSVSSLLFIAAVGLDSLAAYSLYSIPFPWLSTILVLLYAISSPRMLKPLFKHQLLISLLALLFLFGFTFNIAYFQQFYATHPSNTTTGYALYIIGRYLKIINFFAVVALVLYVSEKNGCSFVERVIVQIGIIVSLYALYVYIAQTFGFVELIARNRMGTGGGEQSTVYTYAFHRATGSLREPSHLAEWLILPLLLSFAVPGVASLAGRVLMGFVLLLTGSLTGIISIFGAFILSSAIFIIGFMFARFTTQKGKSTFLMIVKVFILAIIIFLSVNFFLDDLLWEVIASRSSVILSDGLGASNRDYVYEYFSSINMLTFLGLGFGNPQIELANLIGSDEVVSLLNLYANILLSIGLFGLFLLLILFGYPFLVAMRSKFSADDSAILFLLFVAYASWLIAFYVHSEELSLMFAVVYGMLLSRLKPPVSCAARRNPESF
jgi:hypothetical protein